MLAGELDLRASQLASFDRRRRAKSSEVIRNAACAFCSVMPTECCGISKTCQLACTSPSGQRG